MATGLATVAAVAAVEVWVRATWDPRRGEPGLYLSDPVLGMRLRPGYDGWFAGVPVRINSLGVRDPREYSLEKPPGTFRIIVLGDSVTFGHGALFETTYPYLLEQRLGTWRPDVKWEVWNLGVPGYNTRQELEYLKEIGDEYDPDLVIVGFFPNDFIDNDPIRPTLWRRASSAVVGVMQRNLYSFQFFKRAYLTLAWRLSPEDAMRRRLETVSEEAALLHVSADPTKAPAQQLTEVERFDERAVREFICVGTPQVDPLSPGELRRDLESRSPRVADWLDAVDEFQRLARTGTHRIVFFINMAPEICADQDRFYNNGSLADDAVLLEVLGNGTPAVSTTREFLHYRPSQMPLAGGHALGNSNRVKADVLFEYLRDRVLPPLLDGQVGGP